jgi:hypothetical protein
MKTQKINPSQASYWQKKDWQYIPSHATDVLKRFQNLGWKVPSEQK